jgi:hypothetical protein
MFGAPMFLNSDSFDIKTMTQADFDEYRQRLGERSPTPMDAFRFMQLGTAVDKCMGDGDKKKYEDAIFVVKGKEPGDKAKAAETIRKIEQKALGRTQADKERIESRHDRRHAKLPKGKKRVQVIESGKKGNIFSFNRVGAKENTRVSIDFDDGSKNEHTMADIVMLCEVCDANPGRKCTKCEAAYYCDRECQRKDWKEHKKICGNLPPNEWNFLCK